MDIVLGIKYWLPRLLKLLRRLVPEFGTRVALGFPEHWLGSLRASLLRSWFLA